MYSAAAKASTVLSLVGNPKFMGLAATRYGKQREIHGADVSKTSFACTQLQSRADNPRCFIRFWSAGEKAFCENGFRMTAPRGSSLVL
jgi:hypothetical protein